MRLAVHRADVEDAEGPARHAVAAAVAHVLPDHDVWNSVLNSAPVGQASRQGAVWQCLHTSLIISEPDWSFRSRPTGLPEIRS
jgi:hypothetical protein